MQSLNEELTTVNAEMETKVAELARATDDMQNLLNSTNVATVFLDERLNVKRFTEDARAVFHFVPSDIGRPLSDLASNLLHETLMQDCRDVLKTLVKKEQEVDHSGWPSIPDADPALPDCRKRHQGRGDHLHRHRVPETGRGRAGISSKASSRRSANR